jgi:hypothetical protein
MSKTRLTTFVFFSHRDHLLSSGKEAVPSALPGLAEFLGSKARAHTQQQIINDFGDRDSATS